MNRVRMLAYGALGFALVALVYVVASGGSNNNYKVVAMFKDVDGLKQGSTVKENGVPAGTVSSLTVNGQGIAVATLSLDAGGAPIGSGASAQVRPTDLLGEHYVQLNVGNLNQAQPSGTVLPTSRTSVPVELDDILNMFNVDIRTRLRILINEAGIALAGRGADFNTLLGALPPNLSQAQQLLGQVAEENTTLESLIAEGNRVVTAVDGKRDDMGQLIGTAENALHSVVLRQAQLGQTIQNAPGGLSELRATLTQLDAASQAITPAATELQATAGPLTRTLQELPSFARESDPTLITARKVAPALTRLGNQGQGPLRALDPTASDLKTIAKSAVPIIGELNSRAMRDTLWFVENWALGTKGRDNLGHFVGGDLEIDPSIITSALASFLNDNGGALSLRRHQTPVAKAPTVAAPTVAPAPAAAPKPNLGATLSKTLSGALNGVKGLVGSTVTHVTQTLGNVSGAVGSGVNKTIGGLLNGLGKATHKKSPAVGNSGNSGSGTAGSSGSSKSNPLASAQRLLQYLFGS